MRASPFTFPERTACVTWPTTGLSVGTTVRPSTTMGATRCPRTTSSMREESEATLFSSCTRSTVPAGTTTSRVAPAARALEVSATISAVPILSLIMALLLIRTWGKARAGGFGRADPPGTMVAAVRLLDLFQKGGTDEANADRIHRWRIAPRPTFRERPGANPARRIGGYRRRHRCVSAHRRPV